MTALTSTATPTLFPHIQRPSPFARTVARLEPAMRSHLWQGNSLALSSPSMTSGFASLDRELPGNGWPSRCLTELLLPRHDIGEMRLLAPVLSQLSRAGRQIIVLAPAEPECLPYPDGWAQLGVDVSRLLIIRTARAADRLWAIEQSLKSDAFGALLAWLPEARPEALRRLQLASASANGLTFLMRPARAQKEPTAAPLRLLLNSGLPTAPGQTLSVQILKRRGPVLARSLCLTLPQWRSLRERTPVTAPSSPSSNPILFSRHAVGRTPLSNAAPGPHSAQAA